MTVRHEAFESDFLSPFGQFISADHRKSQLVAIFNVSSSGQSHWQVVYVAPSEAFIVERRVPEFLHIF